MNQLKQQLISIISLGFLFSLAAQASDYASGHQALEVWDIEAQVNLPRWIQLWLLSLMTIFVSGLLFVAKHVEARWLVGGVVLGFFFSKIGAPMLGWVPLSGLVALIHVVFWSPALFLMLKNRPFMKGLSIYAVWSGLVTACILFSFVFDIRDSISYLAYMLK